MNKRLLSILLVLAAMSAHAQDKIDLAGEWNFVQGDTPDYNDRVTLPGSMLTNGKGNEVTVETKWVSSLYDSSFFFNPYMAKYRQPGKMKFPFSSLRTSTTWAMRGTAVGSACQRRGARSACCSILSART